MDTKNEEITEGAVADGAEALISLMSSGEAAIGRTITDGLLGTGRPTIAGRSLRPIRLSTLTLLERSGNEIISGKMVSECKEPLMDACRFVVLQSIPIREAAALCDDLKELDLLALEVAEDIDPVDAGEFVNAIITLINESQKGRVEVIPKKGGKESLDEVSSTLGEKLPLTQ